MVPYRPSYLFFIRLINNSMLPVPINVIKVVFIVNAGDCEGEGRAVASLRIAYIVIEFDFLLVEFSSRA